MHGCLQLAQQGLKTTLPNDRPSHCLECLGPESELDCDHPNPPNFQSGFVNNTTLLVLVPLLLLATPQQFAVFVKR